MNSGMDGVGIYIDIIHSRKITERGELDRCLNGLKSFYNQFPEYGIFAVWKGLDEFMIMSPSWEQAIKSVIIVQEFLHPYEQRFVVAGFEQVDWNKSIHEMDHKEFGYLSDGMNELKKSKLYLSIHEEAQDELVNSVSIALNAILYIKNGYSVNQMEIYRQYKTQANQMEIAGRIGKSQQYVSKTLESIKAENINNWEKRLDKITAHGIDKRTSD